MEWSTIPSGHHPSGRRCPSDIGCGSQPVGGNLRCPFRRLRACGVSGLADAGHGSVVEASEDGLDRGHVRPGPGGEVRAGSGRSPVLVPELSDLMQGGGVTQVAGDALHGGRNVGENVGVSGLARSPALESFITCARMWCDAPLDPGDGVCRAGSPAHLFTTRSIPLVSRSEAPPDDGKHRHSPLRGTPNHQVDRPGRGAQQTCRNGWCSTSLSAACPRRGEKSPSRRPLMPRGGRWSIVQIGWPTWSPNARSWHPSMSRGWPETA